VRAPDVHDLLLTAVSRLCVARRRVNPEFLRSTAVSKSDMEQYKQEVRGLNLSETHLAE
jgi:hypothetical protein